MPAGRQKMKNSRLILVMCCLGNFFAGMFYSLLAPFFAIEVSRNLHVVVALRVMFITLTAYMVIGMVSWPAWTLIDWES